MFWEGYCSLLCHFISYVPVKGWGPCSSVGYKAAPPLMAGDRPHSRWQDWQTSGRWLRVRRVRGVGMSILTFCGDDELPGGPESQAKY